MKILFIDIDTLRPDHMGCYGYKRDTTPNLDMIAKEGVTFHNYYCSDAPCLPSRAALISGKFGIRNGAVGHGGSAADMRLHGPERGFYDERDRDNLNYIFRKAGLYTASISTFPERHSSWWFNAGMNETHNVGGCGGESAESVIPVALDWLKRNSDLKDWYLHVHVWDPHTPYRAPEEFGNPFENQPIPEWISEKVFESHLKHVGPHSLNELSMYDDTERAERPRQPGKISSYSQLNRLFDGYDCGIRYADSLIGKLFDQLKEQGIYEETAVIITSDHGENMGELGIYAEHGTADHATCHIPMIIKWPNGSKGTVDDGLRYNLDILPTLAELLNVPQSNDWDGESYASAILSDHIPGRDSLVLSQQAHVCQRSARFGDWIYIRSIHDGFHLFDDEMLFNLSKDPYEQYDVKEHFPEVCAQGAKIILDWQEKMMKESDNDRDPMWTVYREGGPAHARLAFLDDYLLRLEKTGRGDGAKKLRIRHNYS